MPVKGKTLSDLIYHFSGVVWSTKRGRLLLTVWASFLAWTARGAPSPLRLWQKSFKEQGKDGTGKKRSKDSKSKSQVGSKSHVLTPFVKLLYPSLFGKFGATVFIYLFVLVGRIRITTILAKLAGEMGGFFSSKEFDKMFMNQVNFGLWCMIATTWTQSMKYLEKFVGVQVREIVYGHFHSKYFDKKALSMYNNKLVDTSSRLTTDIRNFSNELVHHFGHVVKPIIDIGYLSYDLSSQIGPFPLLGFFGFFYLSKVTLEAVRKGLPNSLRWYTSEFQKREAHLLEHHGVVHDYREEIMFTKGAIESESVVAKQKFRHAINHKMNMAESFAIVGLLNTYVLKYGGAMCAFSMLIPSVYMDTTNKSGKQITADYLSQSSLLGALANAVKDLTDSITCWNELLGYAERLRDLFDKFEEDVKNIMLNTSTAAATNAALKDEIILQLNDLKLQAPDTSGYIAENLSLEIEKGQHTLIQGVNGVGKTSLYRTIAGLWRRRSGTVNGDLDDVQFLPQRPYFMPQMSLRDQITYPKINVEKLDDYIRSLLASVELSEMLRRYKLDDVEDWQMILSGGQKQRIIWARLLFHNPKAAYLDEATAAINEESVRPLYALLKKKDVTIIAISHSQKNNDFFKQVVTMEKDGFKKM